MLCFYIKIERKKKRKNRKGKDLGGFTRKIGDTFKIWYWGNIVLLIYKFNDLRENFMKR